MPKIQYVGQLFENTFRVEKHLHAFWEVVLYTKGQGLVEIGDEVVPFAEGDIFVIPPNVEHTDYSEQGFQNYHYNFEDENFNRLTYLKVHDTENNDFLLILRQLHYEYHLKRKNCRNIMDSLYSVLYHYLLALSEREESNPYVEMLINDMIGNLSNPYYRLSKSLEKIPMTQDYFRKIFFKETGKTPLQYLTDKRIEYARELLRLSPKSGLSIQMIAWDAGFADCYYFSRVFKKITGLSPRKWMEENL
ncbi:MAG: AraC family transcriptional regulator [Lachnospiraceae bacterium]|nr:AraC family transcriptional regulator [Lachnospiraceae bacterium]